MQCYGKKTYFWLGVASNGTVRKVIVTIRRVSFTILKLILKY